MDGTMARFLRRPEVQKITGLPTSSLYNLMKLGRFPRGIRIGPRTVAWLDDEVKAWLEQCLAERNAKKNS